MTFTTEEEAAEALEAYGIDEFIEEMAWGDGERTVDLGDLGDATFVAGKLGEEGGGEDIWFVFSVGDSFFRIEGFYNSYDGSSWEGSEIERVFPRKKSSQFT